MNNTVIKLVRGDITQQRVDAIVNAANSGLMGGGGVDGAIHRAGGPAILEECRKIIANIKSLRAGEAVITTAGNMPSKFVIHTVGPVWHGGSRGESGLLKNAYYNSMKLGAEHELQSIAFPCISTGVYAYPPEEAAVIAFNAVADFLKSADHSYREVRFMVFGEQDNAIYKKIFDGAVF